MLICRHVFPPALLCELASPPTHHHHTHTRTHRPPYPATIASCPLSHTHTRQLMCGEAALLVSAVYLLPFRGIHLRGCSSNKFHSTASAQWDPAAHPSYLAPHTHTAPNPNFHPTCSLILSPPPPFFSSFLICLFFFFSFPGLGHSSPPPPCSFHQRWPVSGRLRREGCGGT